MPTTQPTESTPLVPLTQVSADLFAKLEYVHPTRSAKFRALVPHLRQLVQTGEVDGISRVIIRSAGCAAVTAAWACRELGLTAEGVIPDHADPQVDAALASLGARVHRLSVDEATEFLLRAASDPAAYVLDQFHDSRVVDYYRPLASEMLQQLPDVRAIVAGIGTGASIMGIALELKARNSACRVVGVWPAEFDPTWSTPYTGHGIAGLAPPVRETHLRQEMIDDILQVPSTDAVRRSEALFRQLGLPAGHSSGATVEAALMLRQSGFEGPVACLFASACDSFMPGVPAAGRCRLDAS